MRYSYVPESEAGHADGNRCPVCLTAYGKDVQPCISRPPLPPLVPARPAQGPHEIADGNGQAMSTGTLAAKHGWCVEPWYYRISDGVECSALRLAKGDARAVATWMRVQGGNWAADLAYGWLRGVPGTLTNLGITNLRKALVR
jgi:hypothetical protein